MLAKVNLAHAFIIDDFFRQSRGQDTTGTNNISMIADAECFAHVVVGNQYPDIALFQEANDFLDFEYGNRVDPGEWLVKENEAWIGRQGTGDFDPPPLTTG